MEELNHARELVESSSYARILKKILTFFLVCTIFLLPTCYARTTLTEEEATYIWEYFFTPTYSNQIYGGQYKNFVENSNNSDSNVDYSDKISSFRQYFNQNNDLDISENTWFFVNWHNLGNGFILYWFNFNNTMSNDLPYLALDFSDYNNAKKRIKIYAIDDSQVKVNNYGRLLKYSTTNEDFYDYGSNTLAPTGKSYYFNLSGTWTNTETTLSPIAGITNLARLPESVLYSNWNGNTFFSPYNSYFYKNLYVQNPIIDTGTGTITNESGEIIGNIDLSGIQNGIEQIDNSINNQGQAIIDNHDENTDKIIETVSGEIEKIVEELTGVPDLSGETITSGEIIEATGVTLATDPYANFWYAFTTGLGQALTETTKTSITIDWMGKNETISLTDVHNPLPQALQTFLTLIMGSLLTYGMLVEIKGFINDIQKGGIITTTSRNRLDEDIYTVYF